MDMHGNVGEGEGRLYTHGKTASKYAKTSIVPRPPLFFCSSVHVQYEWKSSEKLERPGLIRHVKGCKVDVEGLIHHVNDVR